MKIDTMRRIDHLVGVPLCFLATFIVRLSDLLGGRRTATPKKILFVELSEMGSAILADPAMRKSRRWWHAELHFVIFASNVASLRLLGTVPEANIFTIRSDNLTMLATDTLRFLLWTRRRGIDTVVDLELFSRYSALLTGLSGAANRVGFHAFNDEGLYRGAMLTHRVAYNPHQHIAKNFIALVNALAAPKPELPYSKTRIPDEEIRLAQAEVTNDAREAMRARIRAAYPGFDASHHRLLLVNPNASDLLPQRRWPAERFVTVMRTLLAEIPELLILITGAPAEREEADRLRTQVNDPRCVNFAGCHRLEDLPAIYHLAAAMLTNDSGPGHFSAITPLRTFVLFGPETPKLYGSLGNSTAIYAGLACSPCVSATNHRKTPCTNNVCLQAIEPEKVLDHLRQALRKELPTA